MRHICKGEGGRVLLLADDGTYTELARSEVAEVARVAGLYTISTELPIAVTAGAGGAGGQGSVTTISVGRVGMDQVAQQIRPAARTAGADIKQGQSVRVSSDGTVWPVAPAAPERKQLLVFAWSHQVAWEWIKDNGLRDQPWAWIRSEMSVYANSNHLRGLHGNPYVCVNGAAGPSPTDVAVNTLHPWSW